MEAASSEFSDALVLGKEEAIPAADNGDIAEQGSERDPSPVSSASAEDAPTISTAHEKKEAAKARRREDKAIGGW